MPYIYIYMFIFVVKTQNNVDNIMVNWKYFMEQYIVQHNVSLSSQALQNMTLRFSHRNRQPTTRGRAEPA